MLPLTLDTLIPIRQVIRQERARHLRRIRRQSRRSENRDQYARIERTWQANQRRREALGETFEWLLAVVEYVDPMGYGLKGFGRPYLYENQVETIIPRLFEARSSVEARRIVWEEFIRWFGCEKDMRLDVFQHLGDAVWQVWQELGRQ
jgi:hypothetical protein